MNRQNYYRTMLPMLIGAFLGMSFILLLYVVNVDVKPAVAQSNFTVVSQYNGCEVVRYTPDNSARYSYFLDCSKK